MKNTDYQTTPFSVEYGTFTKEPPGDSKMECPLEPVMIKQMSNEEQPYTFVVTINDSYCTYEYTFNHTEEVSIHDLTKEIAQKLKCEVPEGKFLK